MKRISVEELVSLIQENKTGNKKQPKPAIVWFNKVEGDILKYSKCGNCLGLAKALAEKDNEIALNLQVGSPLTDSTIGYDESKNVVRDITENERHSFILPNVMKYEPTGLMLTKCYIHSSIIPYIGKKGPTTLEFSKMLHDKLKIPVFLFFPLKFREKIESDFSDYVEYLCEDNLEDIKKRWIDRVSGKDADDFQLIDNFYLDFLKTAPDAILSHDFAKDDKMGVLPRYQKWEELSSRMRNIILQELSELVYAEYDPNNFFTDGNLDFDKVGHFLELIPENKWKEWVEDNSLNLEITPNFTSEGDRMELFKIFICTDETNFPMECSRALLEFHGIK